jgi:formylglycine-generating enzyme required for sulfatase activity
MILFKVRLIFLTLVVFTIENIYAQEKKSVTETIEKRMVKIADRLYADVYEISNLDYNTFLKEMAEKDSMLFQKYSVDSIKWTEYDYSRDRDPNIPMKSYYHQLEGFNNYPVLCVSYEGVLAYCAWLTEKYNMEEGKKLGKVLFTLPTEDEWMLAAKGGKGNVTYPWGHNSMRETRKGEWQGMFLANYSHVGDAFIVSDSAGNPIYKPEQVTEEAIVYNDRAFYTADVRSFFPNGFGLYNVSGNAAEMTIQKGLTKGGSWHSLGGEIAIPYKLYFNEPSPEVGFRVFMKIIEK